MESFFLVRSTYHWNEVKARPWKGKVTNVSKRKSQNTKLEKFRAAAYHFVGSGEEHEKRQQRWETRAVSGHPFRPDVRPGK